MTQQQYDAAKDIVLDLLGWGVPPEYLVTCGLSRQIVYYVFVELNLRLPTNLDPTGLIPFYPPESIRSASAMQTSISPVNSSQSMQPTHSARVPQGSSSQQPTFAKLNRGASTLNPSAPTFEPTAPTAISSPQLGSLSSTPSLLDIEQQRRQELLARKAVLASRKAKQASNATAAASSSTQATLKETTTSLQVTPSNDVDDFLKSIEPVANDDPTKGPPTRSSDVAHLGNGIDTSDAMDIDEIIPEFSLSTTHDATCAKPSSATVLVSPTRSMSISDIASPTGTMEQMSALVTPSERSFRSTSVEPSTGDRTPSSNAADNDVEIPGLTARHSVASLSSHSSHSSYASRRTLRRPVAADFVDMDPGSSYSGNGYAVPGYPASVRRKTGAFAGLGAMRRCVINLSDSEEETDEDDSDAIRQSDRSETVSRASSRYGQMVSTVSHRVSPPLVAPIALQEKEEEIRKMRQLIEERERNRLRKLVVRIHLHFNMFSTPLNPYAPHRRQVGQLLQGHR